MVWKLVPEEASGSGGLSVESKEPAETLELKSSAPAGTLESSAPADTLESLAAEESEDETEFGMSDTNLCHDGPSENSGM